MISSKINAVYISVKQSQNVNMIRPLNLVVEKTFKNTKKAVIKCYITWKVEYFEINAVTYVC